MRGFAHRSTSVCVLAAALGAVGCADAKAPVARAPESSPSPTGSGQAAAPSSPSPTGSNISISDEIRTRCGISDEDAYFAFDSSGLTPSARTPLDKVVQCFTRGPLAGRSLKLVGRADPRGPTDYNLTLGEYRADAVASYLGARGMPMNKAQPTSRGALDANGTDESGWQRDRRVDLLLGN